MYLLDSSACIDYFRDRDRGALKRLIARAGPDNIFICSVVVSELTAGGLVCAYPVSELAKVAELRALVRSLPYDDEAAEMAAKLFANLRRHGEKIGSADLFIAAIAMLQQFAVVTGSVREFSKIDGLLVLTAEAASQR